MPVLSPDIIGVNSFSYADVAGIQLGLDRLPGEETPDYVDRLYRASTSNRSHGYRGVVNEIALHLGLKVEVVATINCSASDLNVASTISGVTVSSGGIAVTSPLLTMEVDDVWAWRKISDVIADINAANGPFSAVLVGDDGPTIQLARQGNVFTVVGEAIPASRATLQHNGIIVGTERFNQTIPAYTLNVDGSLLIAGGIPANLTVSYQYRKIPYDLVSSETGIIGLMDSSLPAVALGGDGVLAYQIRESIQSIMLRDRSYWAK